jgi:pyruvate/2-oxoglutarate dehydrogenase complex dihydrolipoamide dehydrogenase (E3) component
VQTHAIPRVTFTDPEVAAVGAPTWSEDGDAPTVTTRSHADVDRAVAESSVDGFATLALGKRQRIIGATIVGPRAGESLAELTLAVQRKLTTRDLASVIHPYPTYADGPWNAALTDASSSLDRPVVKRLLGILRWWRRC